MNAAVPAAVLGDAAAGTLRLQVRAIRLQAEGIHAFELAAPDGAELPPWQAGAHVDLHLPGGRLRSYSLAGDPAERAFWTLGVLREERGSGGSKALHDTVRVGELLTTGLPRNAFALQPAGAAPGHVILLAGGIGITPLKAMAHTLAAQGRSFELHYCARSAAHAAFRSELQAVVPAGRLHWHFDGGDPARGLDIRALLAEPVGLDGAAAAAGGRQLYYCGPAGFMQACAEAAAHWPVGSVHSEHFKAPQPQPAAAGVDGGFEVRLARAGISIRVQPDQTIVRAIELAGHRVPTSCLSGLCGACKTGYLDGEVDHQDYILSDEERRHCLTVCVSRATSACLVLDL